MLWKPPRSLSFVVSGGAGAPRIIAKAVPGTRGRYGEGTSGGAGGVSGGGGGRGLGARARRAGAGRRAAWGGGGGLRRGGGVQGTRERPAPAVTLAAAVALFPSVGLP